MKRNTPLGLLFLVVGLAIIAAVLGPALLGLFAHPPTVVKISLVLLTVGILVAVYGALIVDLSTAGPALTTITVKLGNTGLPWIGRRAGDSESQATITVATPTPPAELPKDGVP